MKKFPENTVKDIPLARKIEKFTYGLLYPAFFGNMIYDLMQSFTSDAKLKGWDIFIGLMIVLYNALDFMHLYGDMESYVDNNLENKNRSYIICDFAVSLLLFVSFVCLKYGQPAVSLTLFFLVPSITAHYKKDYNWDAADLQTVKRIGRLSVVIGALGLTVYFLYRRGFEIFFAITITVLLLIYAWYIFIFYAAKRANFQS